MTDVHNYDGKLVSELLPNLEIIKTLSLEEKKQKALQLLTTICFTRTFDAKALEYLTSMIDSMGTNQNFDPTNNLTADDLLCLCSIYQENQEFLTDFELQLIDMATGFCPQGRTHRLYQILLAFE